MNLDLLNKWSDILLDWLPVCFSYGEVEQFLEYVKEHRLEMIKQLEEIKFDE